MSTDVNAAALEQLRATLPPSIPVYDGEDAIPKERPGRYVLFTGDSGVRSALAIDAQSIDARYVLTCTVVVTAPLRAVECRRMAQGVQDALVDFRPTVDDLVCSQFVHYSRTQARRDESVADRHVTFAVEQVLIDVVRTNF